MDTYATTRRRRVVVEAGPEGDAATGRALQFLHFDRDDGVDVVGEIVQSGAGDPTRTVTHHVRRDERPARPHTPDAWKVVKHVRCEEFVKRIVLRVPLVTKRKRYRSTFTIK